MNFLRSPAKAGLFGCGILGELKFKMGMKIAIGVQKNRFNDSQIERLSGLGEVVFADGRSELGVEGLIAWANGAEILAPDPDIFGGFEKAKPVLTEVMKSLVNLKGVCLSTTSFGWVDLDYCKGNGLPVSNIPGYSRESVAEHALAMMLGLAKRIFVLDRRTQKGQYKIEKGFELKGRTLGVIGLGSIGSRVAELGMAIGMKVIACNRSPKTMDGVEMKTLDEVLSLSDVISLNTTHEMANTGMIGKSEIAKMKEGVMVVNTVDRELVDEVAMAEAIKSGRVDSYGVEAEDLDHGPLVGVENAVMIKGFGWYTKEALDNLNQIWVENIIALAEGSPINRVV